MFSMYNIVFVIKRHAKIYRGGGSGLGDCAYKCGSNGRWLVVPDCVFDYSPKDLGYVAGEVTHGGGGMRQWVLLALKRPGVCCCLALVK